MNQNRFYKLLVFVLVMVSMACQSTFVPLVVTTLKPGDNIKGLILATGSSDAYPLWAFCSSLPGIDDFISLTCNVPLLPTLAIGYFLPMEGTSVNQDWSDIRGLWIDNYIVDLDAFGTFDYVMPTTPKPRMPLREIFQQFRAWDIVLTNLQPGEHTLRFVVNTKSESQILDVHLILN